MIRLLQGVVFGCLAAVLSGSLDRPARSAPPENPRERSVSTLIGAVAESARGDAPEAGSARPGSSPWSHEVARSFSSISFYNIADALRAQLKIPKDRGLAIGDVAPNSPEREIGLREHDVLLTLGGRPLANPADLAAALAQIGDKPADLVLMRGGEALTVQVQPRIQHGMTLARVERPVYVIGLSAARVGPLLKSQLRLSEGEGLDVVAIEPNGPASKAGVVVGDVLLKVGGKSVGDVGRLAELIQDNGDKPLNLEVIHEGNRKSVSATPEKQLRDVTFRLQFLEGAAAPSTVTGYRIVAKPGATIVTSEPIQTMVAAGRPSAPSPAERIQVQKVEFHPARTITFGPSERGRPGDERIFIEKAAADPVAKRLDEMTARIESLQKSIDELAGAIREKK